MRIGGTAFVAVFFVAMAYVAGSARVEAAVVLTEPTAAAETVSPIAITAPFANETRAQTASADNELMLLSQVRLFETWISEPYIIIDAERTGLWHDQQGARINIPVRTPLTTANVGPFVAGPTPQDAGLQRRI